LKNLEGTYRKWLYIEYRFHPDVTEADRRQKAFRNFMKQVAHHCRCNEYNPELFSKAREIKDEIYQHLIFD
jgi:hypothetical protein